MKGKIILQDITTPVEGMRVVFGNELNPYRMGTYSGVVNVPYESYPNHPWNGLHTIKENLLAPWQLSDLKQIAVEYEQWMDGKSITGEDGTQMLLNKTLPLHPDDWETALPFIDHELSFKIDSYSEFTGKNDNEYKVAKLLLPTPVHTIEDIPEELRYKYPVDFNGNIPPGEDFISKKQLLAWIKEKGRKGAISTNTIIKYIKSL